MTPKQKRFCEEYLIDLNATQAAIRAGYSPKTASEQGSRLLLKNVNVSARIARAMAERSKRTGVTADRVLMEIAKVAFVNAKDVINFDAATILENASPDDTAAVSSVKVKIIPTAEGNGIEREIRLHDKLKGLELCGRHCGMFNDKITVTGNIAVQFSDDVSTPREVAGNEGEDHDAG